MKEYNEFSLESSDKYKNIKSVTFTPLKEIKITKKFSKGDKRYWKLFGFIPLYPYRVKEDLYTAVGSGLYVEKLYTIAEMIDEAADYLFSKDEKLYRYARVYISSVNGFNSTHKFFKTNEEAINYIDGIKKRCQEVGNELK